MITNVSRSQQATLITLAVIIALSPLTVLVPGFRLACFAHPAARLSAMLLGASCVPVEEGYMITRTSLPVWVSLACSGTSFFVLLTAMGLGLAYRHRALSVPSVVVTVLISYALTVLTNTCRITLGWYVAAWARHALPPSMWAGVHLSVGILVFLCALIGLYASTSAALGARWSDRKQSDIQ